MELEIITEKESSPFRHVLPSTPTYSNGRRYYADMAKMKQVAGEFLDSLGLDKSIRTLEVGAGHGQEPSKALLELGAAPFTLDADWNDFCTDIPDVRQLDRIGEAILYPMLAGRNGVTHYLGDIAFIGHERSQLQDQRFNLLFYWGSIHGTDFCSSVAISQSSYRLGKQISLKDRLEAPVPNIEDAGYMASVSGFFNSTGDPITHPKNVMNSNGDMIDVLLVWANHEKRKPKRAIVFGLGCDFASEYLTEYSKECLIKTTKDEVKDAIDNDTIGRFMANYWSMFADYKAKDNSGYVKALAIFTSAQQKTLSNLGIIDCVAVQY